MINSKKKFLDLFSGIGGFRLGLEMADHECVGHVEIDKYANQSYRAIHQPKESEFFHEDITTITDESIRRLRDRGIDIICGGFPCQAFSIAGKRNGFEDTRGTLFFDIARIARIVRPKYLFLENVKGLLNHDSGDTFETILRTLDELGYDAEWQMLNSKYFGVPQNRERVFIIGYLRGSGTRKVFPIEGTDGEVDIKQINQIGNLIDTDSFGGNPQVGRVYGTDGISPCLNTMQGGGLEPKVVIPVLTPDRAEKRQNGRRFKENGEPMFTLTAQDRHGVMVKEATKQGYAIAEPGDSINLEQPNSKTRRGRVGKGVANTITTSCNQAVVDQRYIDGMSDAYLQSKNGTFGKINEYPLDGCGPTITATCFKEPDMIRRGFRIRKLTPRECWRLQGFPDWAFERAKAAGVSDSQLYKQAGNSVTVNVVYEIGKRLK